MIVAGSQGVFWWQNNLVLGRREAGDTFLSFQHSGGGGRRVLMSSRLASAPQQVSRQSVWERK